MARRKTANQQAYTRQMKRIKAALRREEKKGFDVSAIRAQLEQAPTRITKKYLETLKEITPAEIRKRSTIVENQSDYSTPYPEYYEDYDVNTPTTSTYETTPLQPRELEHPQAEFGEEEEGNLYQNERYARQLMNAIHNINRPDDSANDNKPVEYLQSGNEFILYDKSGDAVDKISLVNGQYISSETGTIYNTHAEFEQNVLNTLQERQNDWLDISDYAIEMLYTRTEAVNSNTNGVFHKMFDTVRERVGDKVFYTAITASNGLRSAFEVFTKAIAAGASYPQEFTRFGVAVTNTLPITDEERKELQDAFAEIIEAEYGTEVYDNE